MKGRRRIWIPEAPMVNLRRYREVGVLNHTASVDGFFSVELVHSRTGLVKRRLEFPNLITNAGLEALWSGTSGISTYYNHLAVGTGSAEPDVEDTALVAEIARTDSDGGFSPVTFDDGEPPELRHYQGRTVTRVFTEGQANGNLTELGFFDQSSGGVLWNRQLFRDELGHPTTITKTSEDQLRVKYSVRVYSPLEDVLGTVSVNGDTHGVTYRAIRVTGSPWNASSFPSTSSGYNGVTVVDRSTLYPRNQSSVSGAVIPSSGTLHSYTPGTFYRDREATYGPSVANFAQGIRLMLAGLGTGGTIGFQCLIEPGIPKTDSERFICLHRFSVARREP